MDKRTIIAFVLIGVILILTQTDFYKKRVIPEQPVNSEPTFFLDDTLKKPELVENQEERNKDVVIEEYKKFK